MQGATRVPVEGGGQGQIAGQGHRDAGAVLPRYEPYCISWPLYLRICTQGKTSVLLFLRNVEDMFV